MAMELKKAWNKFKSGLKREGIDVGTCSMNIKQIAKRTATIMVAYNVPYEERIEFENSEEERVQSYDTWSAEQKADSKARHEERIAYFENKIKRYGTPMNEAKVIAKQILESKYYTDFCKNAEINPKTSLDVIDDTYNKSIYLRFNY